jgi:hypothetical protein
METHQGTRKAKAAKLSVTDVVGYRKALSENQTTFWYRFGVTQSGGSRYESGRTLPKSVRLLMSLFAAGKITDGDLAGAAGDKVNRTKSLE